MSAVGVGNAVGKYCDSLNPPSIVSSLSRESNDDGGPYSPVLMELIMDKPRRIPSSPVLMSGIAVRFDTASPGLYRSMCLYCVRHGARP